MIVLPQTAGDNTITTVGMGEKYENQMFYNIHTNTIVKTNSGNSMGYWI
ncbi:MAG: hypothetical protein R2771_00555 [Saprospiraceae bacterium]